MKYFNLFLAGFTLTILTMGCNMNRCISGSGRQVSQVRDTEHFTSIKVEGTFKLVIRQGTDPELRIVADDNVQEVINTHVKNNRLIIEMDGNLCETRPITVYAVSSVLEGVDASGSVQVMSEGRVNADVFDLKLSGASAVVLDINCGDLNTQTSGAAKLTLTGQAGSHNIETSGSTELKASDLVAGEYNIDTSGASKLAINVLNVLNIKSSGASQITYRGNPKQISKDQSGASSIRQVR